MQNPTSTNEKSSLKVLVLGSFGSCLILAGALVGCSQWSNQWSSSQSPFAPLDVQTASVELNYSYVQSNILIPYCIQCHGNSGGVSLGDINSIRQNAQKIMTAISPPAAMPPASANNAMSDSDRAVLYNWLLQGAPVGTAPVQNPINTYPPLPPDQAAKVLNYNYMRDNFITPKCISCHGTGAKLALDTLPAIQANVNKIMTAVLSVKPSMPPPKKAGAAPFRSFTQAEYAIMYNWLLQGAPEGVPTVPVAPPPNPPTFADINSRILQVHCMDCHMPGQNAAKTHPLDMKGLLTGQPDPDNGGALADPDVIPGNVQGSNLIQALEPNPTDPTVDQMPPPTSGKAKTKTGYQPLSPADLQEIETWIQNGAKD